MKQFYLSVGALLAVVALAYFALLTFSDSESKLLCRLKLGSTGQNELLLEAAGNSLLIYRDGNLDLPPDRYLMSDGNLAAECDIPPFKIENTAYTIIRCFEYRDEGPPSRHALVIHLKIEDEQSTYTQYCDVELSNDVASLSCAHFDGPLIVSPSLYFYSPTKFKFEIDGKPTDVRVCIGTVDETIGCWTMVSVQDGDQCSFPHDVRPTATIEFPGVDSTIIAKTFVLDQFC